MTLCERQGKRVGKVRENSSYTKERKSMRRWDGNENVGDSHADQGRDHLDNSDAHALDEGKNYHWCGFWWRMERWKTTYYVLNIAVNLAARCGAPDISWLTAAGRTAKNLSHRPWSGSQDVPPPVVHRGMG